jgi:hypothetical protein
MGLRFPQSSRRLFVSAVIFTAVLGIRLGPWPPGEPVAEDPTAEEPTAIERPVLPVRFRDPAAPEAIVPTPHRTTRIVHHTSARHVPQHPGHHPAGPGHS